MVWYRKGNGAALRARSNKLCVIFPMETVKAGKIGHPDRGLRNAASRAGDVVASVI